MDDDDMEINRRTRTNTAGIQSISKCMDNVLFQSIRKHIIIILAGGWGDFRLIHSNETKCNQQQTRTINSSKYQQKKQTSKK